MSETNHVRKAQTGEPTTNGGHFGTVVRDDADFELAAAASYREYVADTLEDRLTRLGIDFDAVASVTKAQGATTIRLRDPHRRGGWDTVIDTDGGPLVFELHGQRHNTAGYAYDGRESADGGSDTLEVWIRGDHYPEPDADLHFDGQGPNGDLHWSAGNYTVVKNGYGSTVWRQDGDLHRIGGPALINDDGEQRWYLRDREVQPPLPAAPSIERHGNDDRGYSTHTGAKHTGERDLKAAADGIAADIKHATELGFLPEDATIKVSRRNSNGQKVIRIDLTGGKDLINGPEVETSKWYTAEGERIRDAFELIGNAYNRWEEGGASNAHIREYQLFYSIQD